MARTAEITFVFLSFKFLTVQSCLKLWTELFLFSQTTKTNNLKPLVMALVVLNKIKPVIQSLGVTCCTFSTSQKLHEIRLLSRMRIVDNSAIGKAAAETGKPPRVIMVYTPRRVGFLGDKVLVTVKGEMRRAYIVGLKQKQKPNVPRMDTNNIVLVDDNGNPLGNRITVPIPSALRGRGGDLTKILSIATKFV